MTTYSHSRLGTYENCPYKYKLKYIDRIRPDYRHTIETFMGSLVHRTLENLYKDLKFKKKVTKEDLIKIYKELWKREFSEDILIVKKEYTEDNYREMGEEFISNYYDRMEPFDQLTILDLETNDKMDLPDGNKWYVMIDKLACDDKGNYFVCDYKTNSKMKDQKEADEDRQLALYSIWVKERFKDAKSVKLLWHMLAFDKDVISERTDKQLKELQQKVVDKIKEIESAKEFPRKINVLCDYCDYRDICPSFKHQVELNRLKTVKEFKKDEGLQLVDKYSEIKTKLSELKKGEEESKDNLIQYSKQFDIDIVYGSNKKCSVKEQDKIELPEDKDKDELIKLMKEKGVWDEFSMINHMRLNGMVLRGELDTEIRDKIGLKKDFRLSLSKRKDVKED